MFSSYNDGIEFYKSDIKLFAVLEVRSSKKMKLKNQRVNIYVEASGRT